MPKFDYDEFMPDLDGYDMTEEQKKQFLDDLWMMMEYVVEMAWETDPVSLIMKEGEKRKTERSKKD